jgi:CRP/FNR family transcriptional regulator, cyclic AMP receptor protein
MNESRLSTVPLFASLSKKERRRVAAAADEVDVQPGRHLVDQGDWAYEFFAIEEGTAEVLKDGEHVADLHAGDFLGEMGVLGKHERTASVVATSPLTAIVLTAHDLRSIARDMPQVGQALEHACEERARAVTGANTQPA